MFNFSAPILLFAFAIFGSSIRARAHHSKVQDSAIEALTNEWIEGMKSVPEPQKSWALEKIKDASTKDWNSIGDYFAELLEITAEVVGKSEEELGISKRETSEGTSDFQVSFLTKCAVGMLAKAAGEPKQSILEKKFNDALKMKWNNSGEYMDYCFKVFEEVMGENLDKYRNGN